MQLSGVIFDFDGTLANTVPVCVAAFREAIREHTEREYTDAEIIAMFGPSEEGILRAVAGDAWEASFDRFLGAYEREHTRCSEPFPGVVDLLDTLRERGVPVGLVTGKGRHSAEISLRLLKLAGYFDAIETGSPEGGVKPEAIGRVVARWGLPPEQVAYVGDAPSDIADARASGAVAVAAAWAPTADVEALQRANPDALFTEVAAFRDWLCRSLRTS